MGYGTTLCAHSYPCCLESDLSIIDGAKIYITHSVKQSWCSTLPQQVLRTSIRNRYLEQVLRTGTQNRLSEQVIRTGYQNRLSEQVLRTGIQDRHQQTVCHVASCLGGQSHTRVMLLSSLLISLC